MTVRMSHSCENSQ